MSRGHRASRSGPTATAAARRTDKALVSGGLLGIAGLGVLITGDSGIGKSESALELISRGHRFVSDDVVEVRRSKHSLQLISSPKRNYFALLREKLGWGE